MNIDGTGAFGAIVLIIFGAILLWFIILPSLWPGFIEGMMSKPSSATPAHAAATQATGPDDLTRIEGIGPAINRVLGEAGITNYSQLASGEQDNFVGILEAADISFTKSVATWAEQAGYLLRGDESGFKAYTDYLDGGVDPASRD